MRSNMLWTIFLVLNGRTDAPRYWLQLAGQVKLAG